MELLLNPISSESPCGEDPRYLEQFSTLKSEIEKKSEVNYELIEELASELLTTHAKDLRVASYWALARTKQQGVSGLFEGLSLISQLHTRFEAQLHPTKPKAKLGAVQWLQQPKVLSFALAKASNLNAEKLAEFDQTLEKYNGLIQELTGEHAAWPELSKFLGAEAAKHQPKSQPASSAPPEIVTGSQGSTKVSATSTVAAQGLPSSSGQFQQQARLLIRFCKEQKQFGQMIGLARGLLWGGLNLPVNENKQTKVPAFPSASLNRVRTLIEQEQFVDAFIAAEEEMLSPGGLFCFELQQLAMEAAKKAGLSKEATLIEVELVGLYKRMPKLFQLSFDNGDAFASASVMTWLEQQTESTAGPASEASGKVSEWQSVCLEKIQESGLEAGLNYLIECNPANEFERLQLTALRAKAILDAGHETVALPIYLQLQEEIERLRLKASQPEFCLQVWRALYRMLGTVNPSDQDRAKQYSALKNDIFDSVCRIDAQRAIQWFGQ